MPQINIGTILPKNFKKGNCCIIMDFDHTISSASSLTSYGIFSDVPFASQKFIAARKKQFQYFRNEELNPNYPKDQWNKIMKQWAEEAIDLISQHVDEHYMEKLISHAQKNMRIRDGVIEFCKELKKLEIPLIVFSAGVKNVIQPVLEANHIPYDALHANILSFDETGQCTGFSGSSLIHSGNKTWSSVPSDFNSIIELKENCIIFGDNEGDIAMAPTDKNIFSIGMLLSEQAQKEGGTEMMQAAYNLLIESDESDNGVFTKIIQEFSS